MFRRCYRGDVPTTISRVTRHRAPTARPPIPGQSRSPAFDIPEVLLGQLSDPRGLDRIDDILALAHTGRKIGLHQTRLGEEIEVSIQAGSADIYRGLQSPDGRRTEHRQVAQDIRPSAVTHEADCYLNLRRQFWSNEAWHGSILPDARENQRLFCRLTLLLSNRVGAPT